MKKTIIWLLTAVLLLSGYPAACAAESEKEKMDLLLLDDWGKYLSYCEQCYGDVLWVLDYADAYVEELTWDRLNIACAAVCTAELHLDESILPEFVLTNENVMQYMENGLDLLDVSTSLSTSEENLNNVLLRISNLKNALCTEALWGPSVMYLEKYCAALRNYCIIMLRLADCQTNHILLELGNDDYYDRILTLRNESCPEMSKYAFTYLWDKAELEKRTAELLDELDACADTVAEAVNFNRAVLDDMAECIENHDIEAIDKRIIKLDGAKLFPMPLWNLDSELVGDAMGEFLPESRCYFFYEENGEAAFYEEREEITAVPTGIAWAHIAVTKEAVCSYISECEELGFHAAELDEEENAVKAYYVFEDYNAIVGWENGYAKIYFPNSPVYFADRLTLAFGR